MPDESHRAATIAPPYTLDQPLGPRQEPPQIRGEPEVTASHDEIAIRRVTGRLEGSGIAGGICDRRRRARRYGADL